MEGQDSAAPSHDAFGSVLEAVRDKGVKAGKLGLKGIGSGNKVRRMIFCLGEACKRLDQQWMQHAQSVSLSRDGRKNTLFVRYVAVDKWLRIRRGHLGMSRLVEANAKCLTLATSAVITRFATQCIGKPCERYIHSLRTVIRKRTHVFSVEAHTEHDLMCWCLTLTTTS